MSMNEVVKKLSQAIDKQADKAKTTAYDTPATVRRIEGDTAWVHIPGGVDETPVKLTISAKEGDQVQVRVSGGSAFMVGNGTNPPTDDTRANSAYSLASIAEGAAENALGNAARAREAADAAQASASAAESAAGDAVIAAGNAQTAAGDAQQSADSALVSLSTVEDVVGVLNWITSHGTMTLTSDITVNPAHVYFVVDPAGDYVVGGTHYSIVSEPKDAELSTYYELTVDESVQNYVATHIVVDSEGLWIVPDAGGNKVLIATGSGSTYTTAGTYIVGKVGGVDTVLASFTASGAKIGQNTSYNAEVNSSGFILKASSSTAFSADSNGVYYAPSATSGGFEVEKDGNAVNLSLSDASERGSSYKTATASNKSVAYGGEVKYLDLDSGTLVYIPTEASGNYSFAGGKGAVATGDASSAQGVGVLAGDTAQTVIGKFNDNDPNNALEIGNGTADNARSNALTVDWSGNVDIASGAKYKINGTALAASDVGALAEDINGDLSVTRNITAGGDITVGGHSSAIGTITSGAWIKNSSATTSASYNLTDKLSLTPGTYVITVSAPSISAALPVALRGTSISNIYCRLTGSYDTGTFIVSLSSASEVYVSPGSSTSITYSSLQYGGITAVRIA